LGAGLDYAQCVVRAGGSPVFLPPILDELPAHLDLCSAFVLIGGDDPIMERFGERTHPKATPVRTVRQAFETALLTALDPGTPVLGVCFGMQLMALAAGGQLDQHMPDTMGDGATRHWEGEHPVVGVTDGPSGATIASGVIYSRHRQRVVELRIEPTDDQVIFHVVIEDEVGETTHLARRKADARTRGAYRAGRLWCKAAVEHPARRGRANRAPHHLQVNGGIMAPLAPTADTWATTTATISGVAKRRCRIVCA